MPVKLIGTDYRSRAKAPNKTEYQPHMPRVDDFWSSKLRKTDFALEYLIAALLSRGAVVKDQILVRSHVTACKFWYYFESL